LVPSVRRFRGVSRRSVVVAACRTAIRTSARFDSCSEVSSVSAIGPLWVQPSPFDVCRFRPRPSGFFAATSCRWVSRHRRSSLQVLRLLEVSVRQLHPSGQTQVRLSCGLVPYNARQKQAPVSPGGFQPPAPSVLRVSHPLDVLLRLQPWRACFIPPAFLGLSPDLALLARTFRFKQGRRARVSSPRPSLPSRRARVGVLSSLALRQEPRRRGTTVFPIPVKEAKPPNGCYGVSIATGTVYPEVASQGHQPS
jgi:hypothetical protein